jgi:hypothetical protein
MGRGVDAIALPLLPPQPDTTTAAMTAAARRER